MQGPAKELEAPKNSAAVRVRPGLPAGSVGQTQKPSSGPGSGMTGAGQQPANGVGQGPAAGGNGAAAAPENVAPAQLQIESVAIQLNPQVHTPQLEVTVRNTGSSMAETSGGCEWKCPVAIKQVTGFLSVEDRDFVKGGQERVLSPGGGVVNICDGNKLPLPLSCSFSVQTMDAQMQKVGGAQTIHYSQTVTPP